MRELKRQVDSSLYERLALSRDKDKVMSLANEGQIVESPRDIFKTPYVLEFTGLEERSEYSESELEQALIDNLQKFLLELGKGFLFEARQKRFSFDEKSFYVDLVFYNRLLQCYVLIDLKIAELKHQDLGQMLMYVNYFDRYVRQDGRRNIKSRETRLFSTAYFFIRQRAKGGLKDGRIFVFDVRSASRNRSNVRRGR